MTHGHLNLAVFLHVAPFDWLQNFCLLQWQVNFKCLASMEKENERVLYWVSTIRRRVGTEEKRERRGQFRKIVISYIGINWKV